MRVIAGTYRGRPLGSLKGDTTRPTTMRVKESMFSALTSALGGFDGITVLDAFAGSGALGIEALSRGAERVVFLERSRQAAQVVKANLNKVGAIDEQAQVMIGDASHQITRLKDHGFDLVLLDPPYACAPEAIIDLIKALDMQKKLNADAHICYELAKINEPAAIECLARLEWDIVACKKFGDTAYIIARKGK